MDSALDRYQELESGYLAGEAARDFTVHEYIAAIDFQLRFVTMCAAAAISNLDPDAVGLSRLPGFGTYQVFLRKAQSTLQALSPAGVTDPTIILMEQTLTELRASNGRDPQFGTLDKLRNHLFHGNPPPTGETGRNVMVRVKDTALKVSALICEYLLDARISVTPDDNKLNRPVFQWAGRALNIWPFICVDDDGLLCLLSTFGSSTPTYMRASSNSVRVEGHGEELILRLNRAMLPDTKRTIFADFIDELRSDLEGFREPDYQLYHYTEGAEITIYWHRAVSTGTDERTDMFRFGDGDQRQWKSESGGWVPYPDFLRFIVNWQVVAKRIRQHLKRMETELDASERKTLGWIKTAAEPIDPMVKITGLQSQSPAEIVPFDQLRQRIDNRLTARGPRTQIYFVSGEAGIGKTRTLMSAALSRAQEIEAEDNGTPSQNRHPLYYYVRSTGQTSNSLDTVIDAAAAPTQNLKLSNIKALCRHGLIALFVDGFDELLGGVGYDNALGALQTWIEAMDGRGVIVVSARSSYYLNQYSSSLRKEQQRQNLMVEHQVASVQRWDDKQVETFLRRHDVDPARRDSLEESDRKLLELPFFAWVFVESLRATDDDARELPDIVLHQYLMREATKLITPGDQGVQLLDPDELHATFETLAKLMAEQGAREVGLDELEYAAQIALNEHDLEVRPGLTQRLSVLCGLSVSENPGVNKMFSFQHELFYDIFLADAILRDIETGRFQEVITMLEKTQLRVATVARLVRREPQQVESMLKSNTKATIAVQVQRQKAFSANLGLLWEMLVRQTGQIERVEITAVNFGVLDFTNTKMEHVTFVDCQFESVTLPATGPQGLRLVNCMIDSLRVTHEDKPLRGITSFDRTVVLQLIRPGSLVEKPQEVQRSLRELGAPVPAIQEFKEKNPFVDAVDFFLEKYSNRADAVVVYELDLRPADENPPWQFEYGPDAWGAFVRVLKDSGAGKLTPISAGGPAVLRVRINSIERLRNRDSTDEPAIAKFWELVQNQHVPVA